MENASAQCALSHPNASAVALSAWEWARRRLPPADGSFPRAGNRAPCEEGSRSSAAVMAAMRRVGWELVRTSGSHYHFAHPGSPRILTVAHPRKDIPIGTLRKILRSAGLLPR